MNTEQSIQIDLRIFQFCARKHGGWVRLFGYGFGWKNVSVYGPTFSERNGYKRYFEIGNWSFGWLT